MGGLLGPGPVAPPALAVLRADDLLDLRFELRNLRLEARAGGAVLVRVDPTADAHVIVVFGPQHVAEEAFAEEEDAPRPPPPPVRGRLGGPTRLAFRVPPAVAELPLTLDRLLAWHLLEPSLARNAKRAFPAPFEVASHPVPAEPAPTETAIEAPWRLLLSPGPDGRWAHATQPVTRSGRTELWHTRLATRSAPGEPPDERLDAGRAVRAIWSPDLAGDPPADAPVTSLSAAERRDFVRLSSDFSLTPGGAERRPAHIQADRLTLSGLGAWLDLAGVWEVPSTSAVIDFGTIQADPDELERRLDDVIDSNPGAPFDTDEQAVDFALGIVFPEASQGAALFELARDRPDLAETLVALFDLARRRPGVAAVVRARFGTTELPQRLRSETMEWRHRASQGRDNYVRVTHPGFLFPLGNRVALVKVTERKVQPAPDGALTAYLRQRAFIVVKEAFKDYRPLAGAYRHDGRESPFVSVRLLNESTPSLDPPPGEHALFWPKVGEVDFLWSVVFEDREGRQINMSMPLLFVPTIGPDGFRFDEREAHREYLRHVGRRTVEVGGQEVAFAEGRPNPHGDAVLAAQSLVLNAAVGGDLDPSRLPATHPRFLPSLEAATVRIPSVDALLGPAKATAGTLIRYDQRYLTAAFDPVANKGQLFATLDLPRKLGFPAERIGGLVRPDVDVGALSRMLGPVADSGKVVDGIFEASRFLPDAKLLGGLSLKALLAKVVAFAPQQLPDLAGLGADALWDRLGQEATKLGVPAFVMRRLRDPAGIPKAVETQYVWKPALAPTLPPELDFLKLDPNARLLLATTLRVPLDGSEPTFDSRGELSGFAIEFAKVVRVSIGKLGFRARSGRKLDVTAEGVKLNFMGDLAFVNTIRDHIPANGFSDPPAVTVTPEGISAGYTLGLPGFGVGVFSIQNVALSARLTLPFVDQPAGFRFALSERHDPFLVSVSLFGGGGFFALGVHAGGQPEVEASIEFGGNFSLDIVVASGGVHVMAGIYFKMAGGEVVLSGYLRAGGAVTVLGLVTVSVEFYMALTYDSTTGRAWGEASLTVSVEVLFFSASVTLPFRKEFAGASGDPTFDELVEPDDWETYCDAFAP